MKITKTFKTETAHIVRDAFSERCKYNIHGHSYLWELTIEGNLDNAGMVVDFGALSSIKKFVDKFDHSTVFWSREDQTVLSFFYDNFKRVITMMHNPTAENMARLLLKFANDQFAQMGWTNIKAHSVTVHETTTGRATAYEYNFDDVISKCSEELTKDIS